MKSALAAINSEIKSLDAEMKLAVSQMANMDSSEEKNAKTAAILEKQYQANAEKVELLSKRYNDSRSKLDALGEELEEAKKTTGENSEEVQKLQNAYNKQAKATTDLGTELTKAQTKMQDAKNSMDNLGKETDETAGQLEKGKDSVSSFGDMLKAKLTGEAIIAAVKKLADGLKDLAFGAINLSDDLATQAQVTGLSTDALQEYAYMADFVDVSVDTITGSLTKLTRNMQSAKKGTGTAADAFKKLHIRVTDTNGELRSNQDVFDDVIDALGNMTNETERDAIAMELFGKSAQELNPLINAGSETIRAYAQEAHDMGYVMDEDVIAKNVEASDAYAKMKRSIEGAKNYIGTQFAPVIQDVAETISNMIQWLREHEDAVKKVAGVLAAAVAGFVAYKIAVEAASAATALMAANPVTLLIGALTALVTASVLLTDTDIELSEETQELIDKHNALADEVNANAEAYDRLEESKGKQLKAKDSEFKYYGDLAKELDSIVDENGKVKKGYEDRAEVITGILSDALGMEIDITDGVIQNYQTLQEEIAKVIEVKRAEATMKAQEQAYTEAVNNRMQAEIELKKAATARGEAEQAIADNQAKITALQNEYTEEALRVGTNAYTVRQKEIDSEIAQLEAKQEALKADLQTTQDTYDKANKAVADYSYNIQQYESNLAAVHNQEFDKINAVTIETIEAYKSATAEEKKELDKQYGNVLANAALLYDGGFSLGDNLLQGTLAGLQNQATQNAAYAAMGNFAGGLLRVARSTAQVQSPSKATAEIGRYLMEGFSVGIKDEENDVLRQVRSASQDILGAFGGDNPGTVTSVNGAPAIQTANGTYVVQLTLDGKQIATSTSNIQAQRQRAYAL